MKIFNGARHERAAPLLRLRFADEWVGLLVIGCVALFVAAIAEAGILRAWLTPPGKLYLELPQNGLAGIASGDDVQVMGIHAGTIRYVKLSDASRMYAVAEIDPSMEKLIRSDSVATIRRQFVVAGATYIDLSRGRGAALDWKFAELGAKAEANPADEITQTLADVRRNIVPATQNARDITAQLDGMIRDMRAGKGTVGDLLTRDTLIAQAQQVLDTLNKAMAHLEPIEGQVSGVLTKGDHAMSNVQAATSDLRRQMPKIGAVADHVNESTAELPALITQAQTAAASLEKLSNQLRSLWLLGGGGQKAPGHRLSPGDVAP
ncbi:MlaD family protein [Tanticharoenia sakaeratensis]|jgi:phospholipid/cholesterol/gamma-HCH transport system substrate-binding protein|uniref:Mammalian cell entry related domain protein n=1 Tax=Tanticharoenia sakaeratensis NBRC 103193 TaxID=1231623 RepID=A0A0D6MJX9_9PROT|nr:MlaD family protein [Tanticharoenia sakaeratensis]GAN53745.1 mammalian cell entry related domain protein [Tanticharoenia sakaeratensis NBRC 103193]GBQ17033.1 ABC transporter periplasmic protein [Tanticharoenia sakaeratensis NBRC 103193]